MDLEINDPTYSSGRRKPACPGPGNGKRRLERAPTKVVSVTASSYDKYNESAVMTSNGLTGFTASTGYSAGATMTADEGDRRPAGYYYVSAETGKRFPIRP